MIVRLQLIRVIVRRNLLPPLPLSAVVDPFANQLKGLRTASPMRSTGGVPTNAVGLGDRLVFEGTDWANDRSSRPSTSRSGRAHRSSVELDRVCLNTWQPSNRALFRDERSFTNEILS